MFGGFTAADQWDAALASLESLGEDSGVPKSVRVKVSTTLRILNEENGDSDSIRLNKALQELEDLSSDNNLQQMTRTQILSIVSLLESAGKN